MPFTAQPCLARHQTPYISKSKQPRHLLLCRPADRLTATLEVLSYSQRRHEIPEIGARRVSATVRISIFTLPRPRGNNNNIGCVMDSLNHGVTDNSPGLIQQQRGAHHSESIRPQTIEASHFYSVFHRRFRKQIYIHLAN